MPYSPEHSHIRDRYLIFISRMLQLAGYSAQQADAAAKKVTALETVLAKVWTARRKEEVGGGDEGGGVGAGGAVWPVCVSRGGGVKAE